MITRILGFLAVLLALAFGFSWLADRPGELTILWQGQRIEMTVLVAAALVAALVFAVMFVWWLIRAIWTSPRSVSRYFRARNRDRGYQALSTGLIAAGAGDAALARKMLVRTRGLIRPETEPLIGVLEAQTALIDGKHDEARARFEAMAEDPETRELGLHGLYLEALRLGAHEAARHYAEKAIEKAPHLPWAVDAALEYRTQGGQFDDAIRLLETQRALVGMDRKVADRKKAVMLAGRALSKLENDPRGARDDAHHALRIAPDLVPATLIEARALFREANPKKAFSVLEAAFGRQPHGDIALLHLHGSGSDSAADRLKRARKLESLQPKAAESLLAVARAALDARDFALARDKAQAALRADERESAYLLLAELEEAEHGDQGRVRHWLSQALRAPRDPAWMADGQIFPAWLPVSPVSGRLDAFEWRKPPSGFLPLIEDETDADRVGAAIRSLPDPQAPVVIEKLVEVPAAPVVADAAPIKPVADKPVIDKAEALSSRSVPADIRSAEPKPADNGAMPEPFFGRPPDDPGVKPGAKSAQSGGFRLF